MSTLSILPAKQKNMSTRLRKSISGYLFIFPFCILCFTFSVLPILWLVRLSFQSEGILLPAQWVGLKNYLFIFTHREYLGYLVNTIIYLIIIVPLGQFYGFGLALLLKAKTKLHSLFETVYFVPLLISMVAASILVRYLFSYTGPVNYILGLVGISQIKWLADPFLAKVVVSILEIWKGCTFYTFIYVAALRAVPTDYYDCAQIEGAGRYRILRSITLPMVKNTILLCVVMTTIWVFQIFDSIFVLTNGGPLDATSSIVFNIYITSFKHSNPGLGAATALLFLVIILIISTIQRKILHSDIEY
jgi:multiple sugar transport system permease protein